MEYVHATMGSSHAAHLSHALRQLETELAASSQDPTWANRVGNQMISMLDSLRTYYWTAVRQDGIYATIEERMPQEAPKLRRLRVMYRLLSRRGERLLRDVRHSGAEASDGVRQRAAHLTDQIRDHYSQERRLLFEAYLRENGALD